MLSMSEIEQSPRLRGGHDSPASCNLKREALELFAPLPRHYDRVAAILSFGQDPRWRRAMVGAVQARHGERVLDVATGTGLVAQELVRRYDCEVMGLDQSPQMLAGAQARLDADSGLARRVSLIRGEAEQLPFADAEFDHLTFTYLLRYVEDPLATMTELARVVKPGGRIASLEFAVPPRALWRGLWRLYTHVGLPVLGRAVSREWAYTGHFLAQSIPTFYERYPMARVVETWEQAGIGNVHVRRMSLGGGVVMWGTKQKREPSTDGAVAGGDAIASATDERGHPAETPGKVNARGHAEPA